MSRSTGKAKKGAAPPANPSARITSYFTNAAPGPSAPTTAPSSGGLRPATTRARKAKGPPAPPERASPRLARKREQTASPDAPRAGAGAGKRAKSTVYVDLKTRKPRAGSSASAAPSEDEDALPAAPFTPRLRLQSPAVSALSDLTSSASSELGDLTSTDVGDGAPGAVSPPRAASPLPSPPTITRPLARKRKLTVGTDATPTKPPPAAKRPRTASPPRALPLLRKATMVLPSSQSDENELVFERDATMADVDARAWPADDDAAPAPWPPAPEDSSYDAEPPHSSSAPESPVVPARLASLPPAPLGTQLPPQSGTLNSREKTELLLAQMRADARARADALAAEEARKLTLDVPDSLSDSSDEEASFFAYKDAPAKKASSSASPVSPAPSPSASSPVLSARPTRARKQAARRPTTLAAESNVKGKGKARAANPLDALLREKKASDKKGTGEAALQDAERRESSGPPEDGGGETEEEGTDDYAAASRRAAKGIADMYNGRAYKPDELREDDVKVDAKAALKHLGADEGKEVARIVEADKDAPEEVKSTRPVEIWDEGRVDVDAMEVDATGLDRFMWEPFEGESKGMVMLREAWASNTKPRAVSFINPGPLNIRLLKTCLPVLRSFARLSLELRADGSSYKAFHLLDDMAREIPKGQPIPFSAAIVAQSLAALGMKPELAALICADAPPVTPDLRLAMETVDRQSALKTLITLLRKFLMEGGSIPDDEITGMAMACLLIASDAETALALRLSASATFDLVLRLLAGDARPENAILEAAVAHAVWSYASTQPAPAQRHLVRTFGLANGPSLRICRRVCAHLLLGTPPPADAGRALPDLAPLTALLARRADGPFGLADDTDYAALEARVDLLGRVLSGLAEYVALEAGGGGVRSATEAMVHTPEMGSPLELLMDALKALAGRISDTRAAHLDRSAAKSWIHTLQMRVHFEREGMKGAHARTGRMKGPRKITDMLAKGGEAAA